MVPGNSGDLVSIPGPGLRQPSELALGRTPLRCKPRVGLMTANTPLPAAPPAILCHWAAKTETGNCKAQGASPLFGGLGY